MACASKGALPRLSKHGHSGLRDAAETPLPDGARLLAAEGVDNGETILSIGGEWIFCDAFINFQRRITGFPGVRAAAAQDRPWARHRRALQDVRGQGSDGLQALALR
jgi:hypothetical protein